MIGLLLLHRHEPAKPGDDLGRAVAMCDRCVDAREWTMAIRMFDVRRPVRCAVCGVKTRGRVRGAGLRVE